MCVYIYIQTGATAATSVISRFVGIIVCGGFANYYAPDVCVYWTSFTKNVCVCVTIVIVIVIPSEQWTRNPGHPKTIRKAALLYSR